MASSKVLLLGLLAIVATAASVRVAHGYSVDGKEISLVKINGTVLCSSTGNPESGQTCPPLANLKVTLVCPNIPSVAAYTDSNGSFVCPVDTKTYNLLDRRPIHMLRPSTTPTWRDCLRSSVQGCWNPSCCSFSPCRCCWFSSRFGCKYRHWTLVLPGIGSLIIESLICICIN